MAHNLLKLSKYFPEENFETRLKQIMNTMRKSITDNPQNHANWLHLSLLMSQDYYEVVVIGENFEPICRSLINNYLPNAIFAASNSKASNLPLVKNRYIDNKTLIYVCKKGTCQLPVEETEDALKIVKAQF